MTSVKGKTIGLMVDRVSDILTVSMGTLQPVPAATGFVATEFAEGIFARDREMICFMKLTALFATTARKIGKTPPDIGFGATESAPGDLRWKSGVESPDIGIDDR